MDELKEVKR
jgi:Asp-tRNA(Asn)/Glu-tRNA(Gln) amidotransferase B subunit